ncbi:MAG: (Fe-S)-binding protein [Acidimicrobiales bacterium]
MAEAGAFDTQRPPSKDLVDVCVHCGFCLPTCPTYVLWNEEMDSPRGRIVLMNVALEEAGELSEAMVTHWDRCLGCMACVTACPSGVQYDKLIEATRPQVERNYTRPLRDRAFRRFAFETFTHPGRLRALVPALVAARRIGLTRALGERLERFPRLRALHSLLPDVSLRAAVARLPELIPARGTRRARVGMLLGCVQRVFFHQVNAATARVLAAEGFEVFAPSDVRCCGALMLHSGCEPEALELARKTIEAFEGCDYVVVNAAGCGSSMKDYGHLLSEDEAWAERAERFSGKVLDVSQLLVESDPVASRHPVPLKVAYHDACHLAHAQKVRSEPRTLLASIPELELIEPSEWEICCGSAGIYNLLHPDAGRDLGRRKAENLLATGADAIASGNPGCTLQIAAHLRQRGRPLPIYHPVALLDRSIRGAGAA